MRQLGLRDTITGEFEAWSGSRIQRDELFGGAAYLSIRVTELEVRDARSPRDMIHWIVERAEQQLLDHFGIAP